MLIILFCLFTLVVAADLCDDPLGPNCNIDSSYDFNGDEVPIDYNTGGVKTIVGGVSYDMVIQWTHSVGREIDFTWIIDPVKNGNFFDCSASLMWFDGITATATNMLRGDKGNQKYCVFEINNLLTQAYLNNPALTVYFLLKDLADNRQTQLFQESAPYAVIPSDSPVPMVDPSIVCLFPSDPSQCNVVTTGFSFLNNPTIQFVPPTSPRPITVVDTSGVVYDPEQATWSYDHVIQWSRELVPVIDHSWKVASNNANTRFDCSNTRLWLNGTIVGATAGFDGTVPHCIFDIHDGVLSQAYIDNPGQTVFFLLSDLKDDSRDIIISEYFDKTIVSIENYDPVANNPSLVCDSPAICNVVDNVYFTNIGNDMKALEYLTPGPTVVNGVDYEYVVKWAAPPGTSIDFSWEIFPDRIRNDFSCVDIKIWMNGTVFDSEERIRPPNHVNPADNSPNEGDPYCVFPIQNGVLSQEYIDNPGGSIFFLLDDPYNAGDNFWIALNRESVVQSIENYDPSPLTPCDDEFLCNVKDLPWINVPLSDRVELDYDVDFGASRVGGVVYNSVLRVVTAPSETLTHTFELQPSSTKRRFDCSTTKIWINGTIYGTESYLRGARNDERYCVFDINGKVPASVIANPYNVIFLLLDATMDDSNSFYFKRNIPIVSREDNILYLYERTQTTATTDIQSGTTITITTTPKTYPDFPEFVGVGSCNTMETVMARVTIGSCLLDVTVSNTVANVYEYLFPTALYVFCSESTQQVGANTQFFVTLTLRTDMGSCHYFDPQFASQALVIEIPTNAIDTNALVRGDPVEYEIIQYGLEVCSPVDYATPHALALFTFNFTYSGVSIELNNMPFLDDVENNMDSLSKSCTTRPSGQLNNCIWTFRSRICKPFRSTSSGGCALDPFNPQSIHNLDILEIVDNVTMTAVVYTHPTIPTSMSLITFSESTCNPLTPYTVLDITDQYASTVKIRNRPNPNWTTDPVDIKFYEPIIVQVSLDEGNDDLNGELHISTVEFILTDPADDSVVAKYHFNKGDKEVLMQQDWSSFYDDVHFCTFHDEVTNTCESFYNGVRLNPYITANILPQYDDVCQTGVLQSTKRDHFSIIPNNWFVGLTIPTVDIAVNIVSHIKICDGSTRRRLEEQTTTINYLQTSNNIKLNTPMDRRVPGVILEGDHEDDADKRLLTIMYVLVMVLVVIILVMTVTKTRDPVFSKVNINTF